MTGTFKEKSTGSGVLHRTEQSTYIDCLSKIFCVCVCVVLGLQTAQEVLKHPVLSGTGVEGPVHGESAFILKTQNVFLSHLLQGNSLMNVRLQA